MSLPPANPLPNSPLKPGKNELWKEASPALAGHLAQTLADPTADHFSEDDEFFLKFHGIYQQDDRDKRKTGKHHQFMIRARIPGGIVPAAQYLAFDDLAARYGNSTLRVTTRQTFQWHGVVKSGLGPLIKGIHAALGSTIASCGDVVRNVIAPPFASAGPLAAPVLADAALLSGELAPKRTAYHEIWLDGVELKLPLATALPTEATVDPLYGRTYLPRKFKIAFAIPPSNATDVFANCLGLVAIADPSDPARLLGYNLLAGGGMGMSHGNTDTFPRLADPIGYFPREHVLAVARACVTIHRDFGDRTNRKHARLKYVLAERGVEWFRAEVEARAQVPLAPARPVVFTRQHDLFGWHAQSDGRRFLGLFIESGRIADVPGRALRTALRSVVEHFRPEVHLTAAQNLILSGVRPEDVAGIDAVFARHGIDPINPGSAVRRAALACVALPTCGLALAEAERVLPELTNRIDNLMTEVGLGDQEIALRLTGCPNGCARPFLAEIALVGRAPGKYHLYLGGNEPSTRLNRLYRESVKFDDVVSELRPLFQRFAAERHPGERFGDFAVRTVLN